MAKRILLIALAAAVLGGLVAWSQWRSPPPKVSGVIEADEIRLGSRVGGRVHEVLVEEGDAVHQGQVLVRLEEFDLRQRLAEAQAMLAQREAESEKMQTGFRPEEKAEAKARYEQAEAVVRRMERPPREEEVAAAKAQVRLAEAQLEQASQNQRRLQEAAKRQPAAVSREELERAEENAKVTRAAVDVRQQELLILLMGTREEEREEARAARDAAQAAWKLAENGYRDEEKAQAQAAVAAAQAAVKAIEEQLAETKIVSSVDGRVEALELQPGDLVPPNAPVLSLMDTGNLWVRAYIPQSRLDIAVGKELPVTVDAFPGRRFTGRVSFVSRQAEFTPSNVQTYDERAKQVFRIKVELNQVDDPQIKLYPGMTADVDLGEPKQKGERGGSAP
jgi:multidrug resistance efflux pump